MIKGCREFLTLMICSCILVKKSESFILSNDTINCVPRTSSACYCTSSSYVDNNKEKMASNIFCDGTSPNVFPDISLITKPLINSEQWYVGITKNNLTYIPGGSFTGFTPINFNATYLYLDLSQNSISKIENNAFAGLENIYLEIDLKENNVTEVPIAFLVLTQVYGISLMYNPIKIIDPVILQHLAPLLTYIGLATGNMSTWPSGVSTFTALTDVDLSDVHQHKLPQRPFVGSENKIYRINLYGSDLTMLPCSLTNYNAMFELTLRRSPNLNATSLVEECSPNYTMPLSLKRLHLVEGALTEFPNVLKYTPALVRLNLYRNQIQHVNEAFIPNDSALEYLMLSYNQLQTIPKSFLRFQDLWGLVLDNNNIATIAPELEHNLLQYQHLSLCLRDNPVNTSSIAIKCTSSRDSWAPS